MRRTTNKKLEELLNKPIDNNRVFDIGYEHAVSTALEWFDHFLRNRGGNREEWDKNGQEEFIKFMMQEKNYVSKDK